jgi:hypothetical protein
MLGVPLTDRILTTHPEWQCTCLAVCKPAEPHKPLRKWQQNLHSSAVFCLPLRQGESEQSSSQGQKTILRPFGQGFSEDRGCVANLGECTGVLPLYSIRGRLALSLSSWVIVARQGSTRGATLPAASSLWVLAFRMHQD